MGVDVNTPSAKDVARHATKKMRYSTKKMVLPSGHKTKPQKAKAQDNAVPHLRTAKMVAVKKAKQAARHTAKRLPKAHKTKPQKAKAQDNAVPHLRTARMVAVKKEAVHKFRTKQAARHTAKRLPKGHKTKPQKAKAQDNAVPLRKNAKALKIKQHTPQVGVETQLTKHKTMHNKDAEDKNANMKKQAFSKTRIDKDKSFKAATSPATSEVREIRKMEHAALSQVKREVKKAEAEEASLMNARNRGKMDTESSKHTFTNILTKKLEDSTTLKNILSRTEILTNSDRV